MPTGISLLPVFTAINLEEMWDTRKRQESRDYVASPEPDQPLLFSIFLHDFEGFLSDLCCLGVLLPNLARINIKILCCLKYV